MFAHVTVKLNTHCRAMPVWGDPQRIGSRLGKWHSHDPLARRLQGARAPPLSAVWKQHAWSVDSRPARCGRSQRRGLRQNEDFSGRTEAARSGGRRWQVCKDPGNHGKDRCPIIRPRGPSAVCPHVCVPKPAKFTGGDRRCCAGAVRWRRPTHDAHSVGESGHTHARCGGRNGRVGWATMDIQRGYPADISMSIPVLDCASCRRLRRQMLLCFQQHWVV